MGNQEKRCDRKMYYSINSSINEGQYEEWMRVPGGVERRRISRLELGLGTKSEIFRRELNSIEDNNDKERVENGKEEVEKGSKQDKLIQERGKGGLRVVEK